MLPHVLLELLLDLGLREVCHDARLLLKLVLRRLGVLHLQVLLVAEFLLKLLLLLLLNLESLLGLFKLLDMILRFFLQQLLLLLVLSHFMFVL